MRLETIPRETNPKIWFYFFCQNKYKNTCLLNITSQKVGDFLEELVIAYNFLMWVLMVITGVVIYCIVRVIYLIKFRSYW